jgi:hypothetical protein
MSLLVNAMLFQVVWFATVAGAGAGYWWTGLPALLLFAVWQLRHSQWPRADLTLVASGMVFGLLIDSMLVFGGWLRFATPLPWAEAAPVWIGVLWAGFALTLNHSLAYLKTHLGLAVLFGAIGGPLAYFGAARLFSAVQFAAPFAEVALALAVAWSLAMPLMLLLSRHLVAREPRPA